MSNPFAKLPRWVDYGLIPVLNLLVAFIVAGIVVLLVGENPLQAAWAMIQGSFGSGRNIAYTLYFSTFFIFTGLAVAVALHAGLFNIGGEGQAFVGGLGVGIVALALDRVVPWYITFPVAIAASALFGALWAFIPAYLQAYRGSHIVITTIMFNYIAGSLMVFMLNGPLKPLGSMAPQTRPFDAGAQLPKLNWIFNLLGANVRSSPLNITFLLALLMAFLIWLLIWRTKFGYELRTLGYSPKAARYAGISEKRIIILTMLISGALAGMMALNPTMGDQHNVSLDFVAGAGFVGIAVALIGRGHPAGIVIAAILFGALYQGGTEVSFQMPDITRDMIVIIQGLVILFAGALEHMFRPQIQTLFASLSPRSVGLAAAKSGEREMEFADALVQVITSTIRLSTPLLLACLAGLYSERAGVFDIGLEGKMLAGAFAGAAAAAVSGSGWLGLLVGILVSTALALVHGFASITHRGNQIVSGVAINFIAAGSTIILGQAWFQQGGRTPALSAEQRFEAIHLPFADALRDVPLIGHIYSQIISGQNLLTYIAFLMVPVTWWVLYRTRFGLRLRAVGENPAAVDTAGVSVIWLRYRAVICTGVLCGLAGCYLSMAQGAGFVKDMSAGRGYIALAALIFAKWRPIPAMFACLLFGFLDAAAIRWQSQLSTIVPVQVIQALPYILTVILLAGFIGKAIPPKAGGVPYVKER